MITRYALRDPETIANRAPLRRYLPIGFYTGTRDEAIRDLRWECTADGGCIDIEGRFIHRRGFRLDPSEGQASPEFAHRAQDCVHGRAVA